jgi:hypothetical protein
MSDLLPITKDSIIRVVRDLVRRSNHHTSEAKRLDSMAAALAEEYGLSLAIIKFEIDNPNFPCHVEPNFPCHVIVEGEEARMGNRADQLRE